MESKDRHKLLGFIQHTCDGDIITCEYSYGDNTWRMIVDRYHFKKIKFCPECGLELKLITDPILEFYGREQR